MENRINTEREDDLNKSSFGKSGIIVLLLIAFSVLWIISKNNEIITHDEAVKTSWSKVISQYKRRADLIPQLVSVVQGYADHENSTLKEVIEARSKATSIQLTPEVLKDPEAMKNLQMSQTGLTQALSKLMVLKEQYPDLKANENFKNLQVQLEGTENRINVARTDFIETVNAYNLSVRRFPGNIIALVLRYSEKVNFQVDDEKAVQKAPEISFGKK